MTMTYINTIGLVLQVLVVVAAYYLFRKMH
jgi:hypothetical protein